MKRPLRWAGITLGVLAGLLVAAYAVSYVLSEHVLRRSYPIPAVTSLSIPTDPASIAEGRRLATIESCFNGCHGKEAQGATLFDEPIIGRVVAPNLTAAVRNYNDTQLAVIIRNGVRPDGRGLVVMPSEAFIELTDEDLGRIIAFLRSLPEAPGPGPSISLGPLGRIGVATGKFKPVAQLIAETIPPPEATDALAASGRYLARTICAQCHGTDLRGGSTPDFVSPDLRVVAAYSPEAFAQLLRTGEALGGRRLGVMGAVARKNLSHLTDAEIAGLYSYLHTLPEPPRK